MPHAAAAIAPNSYYLLMPSNVLHIPPRYFLKGARAVSIAFSPFYLPTFAFLVLFLFSYLSYTRVSYSVVLIATVYVFTVALPRLGIYAYRKLNGWTRHQLSRRERRIIPYLLSIASYSALLYLMHAMRMPGFTLSLVAGALAIQMVCAVLTPWVKVSTHAAASGGLIGALCAFSLVLRFDPTFWLCLCVLFSGVVCTARLILRQHTLPELGLGVLIGILGGFFCLFIF